jgi:hypothetical protein
MQHASNGFQTVWSQTAFHILAKLQDSRLFSINIFWTVENVVVVFSIVKKIAFLFVN